MADLWGDNNKGSIPRGRNIKCLDIGVGANCVYPIIGTKEYDWSFIGSDTDPDALKAARLIVEKNAALKDRIELRHQPNDEHFFEGILKAEEYIDLTICNPPFHASQGDADAAALRKNRNLTQTKPDAPALNFGGHPNELWYEGGEKMFLGKMILESVKFSSSVFWFTSLVSKQTNLKMAYSELEHAGATLVRTFPMGQGNKSSRVLAWSFLNPAQRKVWVESRWQK
jgi:23S rRNA (adenine1618-N6)-methyltransferase